MSERRGGRRRSVVRHGLTALLLLALALPAGTARAQRPAPPTPGRDIAVEMRTEKRVALVIGNGAYAASPLRNPVNDARDVARALSALGFEVIARENASRTEMLRAVVDFGDRLAGGGVGLFYFSGHGIQVGGKNFMVPIGADMRSERYVSVDAVDVDTVLAQMDAAKNRLNIVILDACRDNPFGSRFRGVTRGLAPIDAPAGTLIAYATAPGRFARDGEGRNGVYTGALLTAVREPGLKLEDVFKRVTGTVRRQTGGEQVPWVASSVEGDFFFSLSAGTAAPPPVVAATPPPEPPRPTIREEIRQELGSLALSARLEGVEVFVGDQRVGATRSGRALVVENLVAGSHRLRARRGDRTWEREVQVVANQRTEVLIDIEPLRPEPPRTEDRAEMVLVPTGEFWMGSDTGGGEDEKPRHRVYLDAYSIDKYEVTNGLYGHFMAATGRAAPAYWTDNSFNGPTQPVVAVSWHDAEAYCKWAGKRLPTEAEWEKAARGTDGRTYPWGDQWDASRANSGESNLGKTAPVGSYADGASPYGAHDMAGNVWEWVADWYDKDYYKRSPERNPRGPDSGGSFVLRGGSWGSNPFDLRTAYRDDNTPDGRFNNIGFRCARGSQ